jgi:predicted signal transduction protein with EAL and GGDEF domain
VFPHDGTSYEALLIVADHAMYRDKAARRGRLASLGARGPADSIVIAPTVG